MTFSQNLNYKFPTGKGPVKIVMVDLNKDRRMDLITHNMSNNSVSVLLGKGNGTFLPPMEFPTADGSACMAVGDLNTDGNQDLALFTSKSIVSLLLGKGDGTFLAKNEFFSPPSVGPAAFISSPDSQGGCIVVEDVNGDGRLDLILNGLGGLGVLLSQGNNFPPNQFKYIIGGLLGPQRMATGRLSGPSTIDLVVCVPNAVGGCGLLNVDRNGNLLGRFNLNIIDNSVDAISQPIPMIDNGRIYILKNTSGKVSVLSNLQDRIDYPAGISPTSMVAGDFTGDGIRDLAMANSSTNSVSLLQGTINGALVPSQIISTGQYPVSLASGDVNGDGSLDLAVANFNDNSVNVILSPQANLLGKSPRSMAIGDVNGDKNLDLVTANGDNTVSIFLGNGDGFFQKRRDMQTGSDPHYLIIGDLNRDNRMDLAILNRGNNTVSVILATTDGTFLPGQDFPTGQSPISIAMGDINMDGSQDLIVANNGSNSVSVLLNKGNGVFLPKQDFSTGWSPVSVAMGDLNEDGRLDLVVTNDKNSAVSVMLGEGNRIFRQSRDFFLPNMASIVKLSIAHADSDSHLDVIALDGNRGIIYTMMGSGNNSLIGRTVSSAPLSGIKFTDMEIKDVDGDGYNDVSVCYSSSDALKYYGIVSTMIGNGNGNFVRSVDVRTNDSPSRLVIGDINKDGVVDLVTFNSNSMNILFNTSR